MSVNFYKLAPTFLYREDGTSKSFKTQEEVDEAWAEGWFGPPWLLKDNPLISTRPWGDRKSMLKAVEDDPRYKGLELDLKKMSMKVMLDLITQFETDNDIKFTPTKEE